MNNVNKESSIYTFDGQLLLSKEILRIEESFTDTFIVMLDGHKHKSALSIDELEWELPKDQFNRVHPKHLINIHFKVHRFTMNMDCIQLLNGDNVPVAKDLVDENIVLDKPSLKNRLFNLFLKKKEKSKVN